MSSNLKTQQLVLSIIEFLNTSIDNGTVKRDDREGLEVAIQCIGEAFGVDPSDSAQSQRLTIKPATLSSLFDVYLKSRDKVSSSTPQPGSSSARAANPAAAPPSPAAKAEAEKHKADGNKAMSAKNYTAAIDSYTKAVELDGSNPVYYSNRAAAYSSHGDHEKAIVDAQRALEVDSKFSKAYHRLGYAHFSLGRYNEAQDAFEQGLALDPNNAALRTGLDNAKAHAETDPEPIRSAPAAGGGGTGMPDLESMMRNMGGAGGPGAGGMPDLAGLMNNPMMRQMAEGMMANGGLERLMQNPAVANMMNRVNSGGGMPSMAEIMSDPTMRDLAQNMMGGGGGPRRFDDNIVPALEDLKRHALLSTIMATSLPPDHPEAQVKGIIADDVAKGVAVHSFDPDASPEEKAATASRAKPQLGSIGSKPKQGGKELAVDLGGAPTPPTITISDPEGVPDKMPVASSPTETNSVPGDLPAGRAPEIPDWYRVGWRQVAEIDRPPLTEGEEKNRSVLEEWIKEQYYGAWYHNAAVIFFAVTSSHFLTVFHFGWGWLFLILIACASYYSLSMERVRRRQRDDIQRELVKTRLVETAESADWINNFLDRFWIIYEPVLSATVISSVDQILSANTPPFLDSIRLSTFTLGNKAPRINSVKTYPHTPEDIVTMDWALSFTPCDISDVTPAQAKNRVNPKIVLSIRIGKGFAGGTIPILLEDIEFSGEMTIRLKLMTNFPHVQIVDLSFKKPPVFDYVLKPVGGETLGFDIAHIPGLSSFIRDMTHSTLGPMMYAPNMFTLNLEQMLSGAPLDAAIGVLQVTVRSARSLKGVKIGGGRPDPYVALSISQRAVLAETSHKENTHHPSWHETKFLLINSLTDVLNLTVMDHNDHRNDDELGAATFDLALLAEDATRPGIEAKILKDGKERGDLRFDINFYPVLKPQKLADGTEETVPETSVGIVRLTVHQAKDLDHSKSMSDDLNPFARVLLGSSDTPIHTTARFKHTNNPVWESATEFLCADKASSWVTVQVVDDRTLLKDPIVGHRSLKLADLLEAKVEGKDWFPLDGCKSGRIRLSAEWKPLNMAGSLQGADQYTAPIGVVRLWVQKATDLKNVEAALGGKSDPYLRILVNNVVEARTEVINNNLNPTWDEIIYVPVHDLHETLLLECMDYQHLTRDRSLGSTELRLADLAKAIENSPEKPYESLGKKEFNEPLRLDKGNVYKGNLIYAAEFVPCTVVQGIEFDDGPNELTKAIAEGDQSSSASSSSDSDSASLVEAPPATPPPNIVVTPEPEADKPAQPDKPGIVITPNDLSKYQTGVIVFNIVKGSLAKKGRLEIMLDDSLWPACSTQKATSTHAQWNYVGEGFVKELDFSRVWFRLNENDENEKDDIVGDFKLETVKFLQQALNGPVPITLADEDGSRSSVVHVAAKFVPVNLVLEARESLNNQGILRVELIDGKELHAADRAGKSDPYVVFTFNGDKVYKSQTKKKTLHPEWNETFTVQVPSRVGSEFQLEVFDWNQIEQAKSLGTANVELAGLDPFQGVEREVQLTHTKHGEKGAIRLMLTFQPEIIAKSRRNTSTFASAGRAMTQVGHLPFDGAKGVVQGVGSAGSKVTSLFKRDKDKPPSIEEEVPPAGAASKSVDEPHSFPTQMPLSPTSPIEPGIVKVTILNAKDLSYGSSDPKDIKPYVQLRLGEKDYKTKNAKAVDPEWNEAISFSAGPDNGNLIIEIFDHKTFGKDKLLAHGTLAIWEHVQAVGRTQAEVWVELREKQGQLRLRLDFERISGHIPRGGSITSLELPRNGGSPSRFLSLRKRGDE